MKNVAIKILAASFVLAIFTLTGCKKPDAGPKGDQGPQGPQGPVVNMLNDGLITATLTGTRRDGTPFSESFSYTYYFPGTGTSGTLDSLGSNFYGFNIQRQESDIFSSNYCYLNVTTTSKTATTGTLNINIQFEKVLSATQYFSFNGNTGSATAPGLSYNATTGLFSGAFNVTIGGSNNSTGNTATLIGSFQATMIQKIERKHQDRAIRTE